MSLMGTLAKVAIGVAVAKGVSMMQKSGANASGGSGPFGGSHSPGGKGSGIEDMMGEILGGRGARAPGGGTRTGTGADGGILGGSGGGLGDFLEELGPYASGADRKTETRGRTGGLDDLIGSLGAGGAQGGGLGDLLGGLLGGLAGASGGAAMGRSGGRGGSFGDILNQSLGNRGEPDVQPTREQDAAAALMLRAMIQAAKSDGKIDAREREKLLGNLGDVSSEEKRFVDAEMQAPVDVDGLARQIPRGLEAQVYTMSVMAIDLDNRNEAQYLHQLATAMGIDQRQVNHIHARLGVPALYS